MTPAARSRAPTRCSPNPGSSRLRTGSAMQSCAPRSPRRRTGPVAGEIAPDGRRRGRGRRTAGRGSTVADPGAQRHRRRRPHQHRAAHRCRPPRCEAVVRRGRLRRRGVRPRLPGARSRRGRGRPRRPARRRPDRRDALVVNNGAAALVLAATALAAGREVLVSRGELVEIGDGFRLPDLHRVDRRAAARGRHDEPHPPARLRRRASGPTTGCILKVHPSNFTVDGFTVRGRRCASWPPDGSVVPSSPTSAAGCCAPTRCCRTSRTPTTALRAGADRGHRERRQAARRPAGRAPARRAASWSSGCAGTRWPGRCASTS